MEKKARAVLHFCNKEGIDSMIKLLEDLKKLWDKGKENE